MSTSITITVPPSPGGAKATEIIHEDETNIHGIPRSRGVGFDNQPDKKQPESPEASFGRSDKGNNDIVMDNRADTSPEVLAYANFKRQVLDMDKQLCALCNEARKLGNSAGILSALTRLRERLGHILQIFESNTKQLHPNEMQAYNHRHPSPLKPMRRWKSGNALSEYVDRWKARTYKVTSHVAGTDTELESPDLARQFYMFAEDILSLLDCFGQFQQFMEEIPQSSFPEALYNWARPLQNYQGDHTLAVQRYLDDSMTDIGNGLEVLTKQFLPAFVEIGIPTFQASQERGISDSHNQTVVATLFAGLASSMLQTYSDLSSGTLKNAISVLWYMCLIFSISSAVDGLFGLTWKQSVYRSPDRHVPWWILIWIKQLPFVFLVLAVACSFVALILISFMPQQHFGSSIIITVLSTVSCLGLLAVSVWFVCETLVFFHYEGKVWLKDAVHNMKRQIYMTLKGYLTSIVARWRAPETKDVEESAAGIRPSIEKRPSVSDSNFWDNVDQKSMTASEVAKYRWHEAVRRIILSRQHRELKASGRFAHLVMGCLYREESPAKLSHMSISQADKALHKHDALVRSLQFSPDGGRLLSSSMGTLNYRTFVHHFHPEKGVALEHVFTASHATQFLWSPDSQKLLSRSNKEVCIWRAQLTEAEDGKTCQWQVMDMRWPPDSQNSSTNIRSICWNGEGTAFFLVEENRILMLNAENMNYQRTLDLPSEDLKLRNLCVTSDSNWLLCSGAYLHREQISSRNHVIIVYDLKNSKVVKQVPIYHAISNITSAKDNRSILVSYEDQSPSQLWRLDTSNSWPTLSLRHSYLPQAKAVDFAALPSILGGRGDRLVMRAGEASRIYVWHRESAVLIHTFIAPGHAQLTSFTWNRGSASYMLATGMSDGSIEIWTEESEGTPDDTSRWDRFAEVTGTETKELPMTSERTMIGDMD